MLVANFLPCFALAQQDDVEREPAGQYRSPDYVTADAFADNEIVFGQRPWELPGTLSLPRGEGPFPAVVLVHGSGPNDRDETIGPNKPFRDLAHGLASRGIAVLRYEKRTREHSLRMLFIGGLTTKEETIDDAVLAVEFLRSQTEIDEKRIFLLGHSLGGMLIPRIAERAKRAAGFICLAGSVRSLDELIEEQVKYILSLDGELSESDRQQIGVLGAQLDFVRSEELTPNIPSILLPLGVPASYWLDLRDYRPAETIKEVRQPMLFLQGERDYQVTMVDFQMWKEALADRENVQFIAYPKLNHLFMAGEGKSKPAEYMEASNVDEEVVRDIAAWIKAQ